MDAKKNKVIEMSVTVTKENLKVQNSGLRADTEVVFLTLSCFDLFSISTSADRLIWMLAFLCVVGLIFQKYSHLVRKFMEKKPRKYQNRVTLLHVSHSGHVDLPAFRPKARIVLVFQHGAPVANGLFLLAETIFL